MAYQTLTLGQDGPVATITLNRPERRNAVTPQMISELLAAFSELETSTTRIVIITGSGKAFCAGMDLDALRSLAGQSFDQNLEDSRLFADLLLRIYSFPKPVIAAVNGAAIGGGCGIATVADLTLAAPEARFGYTEVKIGFLPAVVSVFLRRQVGEKRTRDLLLSGRIFDAVEACQLGIAGEIVPADQLASRARELANTLLSASPASIARTKRLLFAYDEAAMKKELELAVRENAAIRSTPDFREGLSAFLEKREPKWSGD
jgi:methylglutaconyl-CoA hydratase